MLIVLHSSLIILEIIIICLDSTCTKRFLTLSAIDVQQ